jgi:hypothetical protein
VIGIIGWISVSVIHHSSHDKEAGYAFANPPHGEKAIASDTEPAKLLAIFVVDGSDNPLTVPDK